MKLTQEILSAFTGGWLESHTLRGNKYVGSRRTNFWRGTILFASLSRLGELWISLDEPEERNYDDQPWREAPSLMDFRTLSDYYDVNNIGSGFGDSDDTIQFYSRATGEVIILHPPDPAHVDNSVYFPLWLILADSNLQELAKSA